MISNVGVIDADVIYKNVSDTKLLRFISDYFSSIYIYNSFVINTRSIILNPIRGNKDYYGGNSLLLFSIYSVLSEWNYS